MYRQHGSKSRIFKSHPGVHPGKLMPLKIHVGRTVIGYQCIELPMPIRWLVLALCDRRVVQKVLQLEDNHVFLYTNAEQGSYKRFYFCDNLEHLLWSNKLTELDLVGHALRVIQKVLQMGQSYSYSTSQYWCPLSGQCVISWIIIEKAERAYRWKSGDKHLAK